MYFVQVGCTGLLLASFRGHADVVATLLSAPGVLVDSADNEVCVCAHGRVGFVCVAAVPVAVSVLGLAASAAQQI